MTSTPSPSPAVVIVEGLIGCGKSSLASELGAALGAGCLTLLEPDERDQANPYLASYYEDPVRWGFTMQVHLLALRYRMHLRGQWHALNRGGPVVIDRSYFGDTCFIRMLARSGKVSPDEFETYRMVYHAMTASVLLPTACVRILVSPETAAERIRRRSELRTGRRCESVIDLDYLCALDEEITYMVGVLSRQGVAVIDMPWDVDRETPEQRQVAVRALAERIQRTRPADLFLDLHRRTV